MNKFHTELTVTASHLDELKHVNNVEYVRWIEKMSKDHWNTAIKGKLPADKYIWMVTNHNIQYLRQAFLGDELLIETFIENFRSRLSDRRVIITNKKTKKVIMKSLTQWCLVSPETGRSILIPEEINEVFK